MNVDKLKEFGIPGNYVDYLKRRGISALNPVQVEAISKGLFTDKNIVVVAPTASGKTLIAELALVKSTISRKMGIYLVPLRALANAKYEEFKQLEEVLGVRVEITTGDYEQPAEYLSSADIVVATYERFDSIMRLKPSWLGKVSTIVVDELHNIGDPERGPVVEMIVTRARRRGMRLIGLSASIGNPRELAEWIGGELVTSEWRPVKLVEGVYVSKDGFIEFVDGRRESVEERSGDPILDLVLHNLDRDMQTLVFVHNRKRVEELALETSSQFIASKSRELSELLEELEEAPTRLEREALAELLERGVAFHHAGLSPTARRVVEEAFRKRLVKVVYATPTLAAGVNLPARRVLVSIKRYDPFKKRKANISIAEYKQMAGRAGRPQYDEVGEAIIVDAGSLSEGMKYIRSKPEPVSGMLLAEERSARIHVLAAVASGEATKAGDLVELLKGTFSARRGGVSVERVVESTLSLLEELKMVEKHGEEVRITRLGRVTSHSYLDPATVSMYLELRPREYNSFYMLHLIALTPDFTRSCPYIPVKMQYSLEDLAEAYCESRLTPPMEARTYDYDDWLRGFVAALALHDWISEKREDEIYEKYGLGPGDLYSMKDTASWIAGALSRVSGVIGDVTYYRELLKLSQRLDKGVREDALELASLRYIGRVRARVLIEHGIKTLEDLAKTPPERLLRLPYFGPKVVKEIYRQLEDMGYVTGASRVS